MQGAAEPPVKQVAACNLQEAMKYMRKRHADFDILHVQFVALIEMVAGSPLD
jgi:predicted nucleic acid-binding Zn ribbon protein